MQAASAPFVHAKALGRLITASVACRMEYNTSISQGKLSVEFLASQSSI